MGRPHSLEALEARIAPATVVTYNSGTGLLSVAGDFVDDGGVTPQPGAAETITFSISGSDLLITDPTHGVTAVGPNLVQVSPNQVSLAVSLLTGDFTIETGTGADSLTFNDNLAVTTGNALTANTAGTIALASGSQLTAAGTGSISLTAARNIQMDPGASLAVVDGNLTLSANAGGATVGQFAGLRIDGGLVTTSGTGNISLAGNGGVDPGISNFGFHLQLDGVVSSTMSGAGAGTITIVGVGGGTGTSGGNYGVELGGVLASGTNNTKVSSVSGAISITGTGGSGSGTGQAGIVLRDGGQVVSTGTGASAASITLTGTAGSSAGGTNTGIGIGTVDFSNAFGAAVTSVDGAISLSGVGGASGTDNAGIDLSGGAKVEATGTGAVSLTGTGGSGSTLSFGVNVAVSHANGIATMVKTASGLLTITGTPGSTDEVGLAITDSAVVSTTSTGNIVLIADSMTLSSAVNAGPNSATLRPLTNGTSIDLGGADAAGTLGLTDSELDTITAGALNIGDINSGLVNVSAPLTLGNNITLTTGSALNFLEAVTMASNRSLTANAAGAIGLPNANSDLSASGTGAIALTTVRNIQMDPGASLAVVNGNLTLSANAGGGASGNFAGISMTGAAVATTGTGSIGLTAQGGLDPGNFNYGIQLQTDAVISSSLNGATAGGITLNGTGGGSGGSNSNYGLQIGGFQGAGPNATRVSSVSGPISITGTGGSAAGNGQEGIDLRDGGQVVSTGTGPSAASITLLGTAGSGGAGSFNIGISLGTTNLSNALGTAVTSVAGAISLTGAGAAGGSDNHGIQMIGGTKVESTGSGAVSLTGTAGAGAANAFGIEVSMPHAGGTPTMVLAASGNLSLTGTRGDLSAVGLQIATSAQVRITGAGSMLLSADSMNLASTVSAAGTGTVTLRPLTVGLPIDLGTAADASASTLGLADVELDFITAGRLIVGDSATGTVNLTAALTVISVNDLTINAGPGGIQFAGGSIDLGNGALTLATAGRVVTDASGTDITANRLSIVAGAALPGDAIGSEALPLRLAITTLEANTAAANGDQFYFGGAFIGAAGLNAGSGVLSLAQGTYALGGNERLGDASSLILDGATFNLSAFNETISSLNLVSGAVLGTGTLTAINSFFLKSGTVAAKLSGTADLQKDTGGTVTLSGLNSYTGGTLIEDGVLFIGSDRNLGTGGGLTFKTAGTLHATKTFTTPRPIFLQSGTAIFEADAGKTLTLAGVISGPGNLTFGTGDVRVTNGANSNTGAVELDSDNSATVNGVTVSAPGNTGEIIVTPGPTPNSIASIEIAETTKVVSLSVKAPKGATTQVDQITSAEADTLIRSIVLGPRVTLGNGLDDLLPDLTIAGNLGKLTLSDVNAYTIIKLGTDLPYLSTFGNKPNITLKDILGPGVTIDASGDGITASGVGGGGLGVVTVNSWTAPGTIKTTQGIKSFVVKRGDSLASLQMDPAHLGASTVASIGKISIPDGRWAGETLQVEGVVAKFLTKGLAEGAILSAGAFGTVTIKGSYEGSIIALADPSVSSTVKGKVKIIATGDIASVSIAGDFAGLIGGEGKVGDVTLSGSARFQGTLYGKSLGNIVASSFTGSPEVVGGARQTITSAGSIGAITAKVGGLTDYIIAAGTDLGRDAKFGAAGDKFVSTFTTAKGTQAPVEIASVTIAGAVRGTTIAAGIDPGIAMQGATPVYGLYGDTGGAAEDTAVALPGGVTAKPKIGALKFEMAGRPASILQAATSFGVENAIEAGALKTVQFGAAKSAATFLSTFEAVRYIDGAGRSTIVRLL